MPRFIPLFAFICLYLPFFLSLYLLLVLLSFVGLVAFRFSLFVLWFSLWVFVFSFSLADYTQKERAQRFCSLRPLLSCCGLLYLRIAAAFLSATAAALWHSWSDPKNGGICGNSGINTIKQSFNGCFSIFANLNDFIT